MSKACPKRVARQWLMLASVEKTDSGKWKATKGDKTQYFDDKDKATAWVKDEKGGDTSKDKPTGFAKKLMSLGKGIADTLKKLPENTQKFIGDKDFRDKTSKEMAKSIKEKTTDFAKHAVDHLKHEMKEVGGALKAISKGEKPTPAQMKACAGLAIEIGIAAFAASTAGAGAGAGTLAKGIVKHTLLSTASGGLGDAYVFGYGGATVLGDIISKIAAEEDEEDPQKFAEELAKFVAYAFEKGISDEVMEKAIKEMSSEKKASPQRVSDLYFQSLEK